MKNLKLSHRISIGFGIVLLLVVALGGVGIYEMSTVNKKVERLAEVYVPELDLVGELQRASVDLALEAEIYQLTGDPAQVNHVHELVEVLEHDIEKASRFAAEHDLETLADGLHTAEEETHVLAEAIDESIRDFSEIAELRHDLDEAAASYMQAARALLTNQQQQLAREVKERNQKIEIITGVVNLGTAARVANFKAQVADDPEQMHEAAALLEPIPTQIARAREVTRLPEDLAAMVAIEEAAGDYQAAMVAWADAHDTIDLGNASEMAEIRQQMDAAAQAFVTKASTFFSGQQNQLAEDVAERALKLDYVQKIVDDGNQVRVAVWKAQAHRNVDELVEASDGFPLVFEHLKALEEIMVLPADREAIETIRESANAYSEAIAKLGMCWRKLDDHIATSSAAGELLVKDLHHVSVKGVEESVAMSEASMATLHFAQWVLKVGLALSLVMGAAVATYLVFSLTRAIRRVTVGLATASSELNAASNDIGNASQSLAEGASEQAAGIEETTSTVEEVGATIQENAANATEAESNVEESIRVISGADQAMTNLTEAMNDIQARSEETKKIVTTIDEIAFQTNLLALNAAVEAARAGEAGAGFAVVADEVRALAQRAADAARNTSSLIDASSSRIGQGANLVGQTNEAFSGVRDSANQAAERVREIANACREQALAVDGIAKAMSQMDEVTQHNAAGAEQTAASSRELICQSEKIEGYLGELARLVDGANAVAVREPTTFTSAPTASIPAIESDRPQPVATNRLPKNEAGFEMAGFED